MARKDLAAVAVDWEALAAEVLVGIKDWRTQHPKATFTEIEEELDRELSRLRTRLLEDVALASAAAGAPDGALALAPPCPTCGGRVVGRGQATRAVTVTHNQTVTLRRQYGVCSSCGASVFPPR
jgi:hypothetical protein